VRSKYKTVRFTGYQEPAKVGYTDYKEKVKVIEKSGKWKTESTGKIVVDSKEVDRGKTVFTGEKKFVQGSAKVVKTERGIETAGSPVEPNDGGSYKRTRGADAIGKKSVGQSTEGKSGDGSIFKRKDSNGASQEKTSAQPVYKPKSNVKKGDQPAVNKSNNNGSSGTYKKSSNAPAKKVQTPSKSGQSQPSKGSDAKAKKSSPPPAKTDDDGGKKSDGASMKSAGNPSPSPSKAAAPAKSSGNSKATNSSGKSKGGGKN
jgi:hypothetical protein